MTPGPRVGPRFATEVFGEGGLLSRVHPGFELRRGQIRMSEAVAEAIERRSHLVMEAPTGTGKTFAYLVPAIQSNRKVVISTGTKNLQEQLFFKDLPEIEKVLGVDARAAYMKGRDNYLCVKRFREFRESPIFEDAAEAGLEGALDDWGLTTQTGDRGELGDLPDNLRVWDRLNARADICLGQRCPDIEPCFLTRMRRAAEEARIVVVNHHLLMADLVLRDHAFGKVIPDYTVLIIDEAHALEDVATAHMGRSVTSRQVGELCDDVERVLGAVHADDASLQSARGALDAVRATAREFFGLMSSREPSGSRFTLEAFRHDDLWRTSGARLVEALDRCVSLVGRDGPADDPGVETLLKRARDQRAALRQVLVPDEMGPPLVTWGEIRGRSVMLHASPIDVSGPLRDMLFSRVSTVVLTSATLAVDGTFEFIRSRLGLDEPVELALESPFDAVRQAVLYVPRDLPEPRHESFVPRLVEELRALLDITRGRAFVLFTAYQTLRRVRERLEGGLPYPLLVQGEASRRSLLERFRSTQGAVLLATSSFWHGVDVQGEALSLVVIDKLPFDVPSDPIVAARIEAIRREGGVPFSEYQVPAAVIDLKQGLGRLIRSRRDRGVLAVMDTRLLTRPYGRVFLQSLPPYPVVHDLESVGRFFHATR